MYGKAPPERDAFVMFVVNTRERNLNTTLVFQMVAKIEYEPEGQQLNPSQKGYRKLGRDFWKILHRKSTFAIL